MDALCETCFTRPVFGLLTLHSDDGHLVAAWWTCCECADHDAPIHTARGMKVAISVDLDDGWTAF